MNSRLEGYMVLRSVLLGVVSICAFGAANPELPNVKTVYMMQMTNGLDQYLANQLTKRGVFEVVTDPNIADAVFTDRIGTAFEQKWEELYPPPPPPKEVEEENDTKDGKESVQKGKTPETIENSVAPAVHTNSFGKGRGNVFLVSRKTRAIIWSHYAIPKDGRSTSMNSLADKVINQLTEDLKPPK